MKAKTNQDKDQSNTKSIKLVFGLAADFVFAFPFVVVFVYHFDLSCVVLCCLVLCCVVLCCLVLSCLVLSWSLLFVFVCCLMLCCVVLCCLVLSCLGLSSSYSSLTYDPLVNTDAKDDFGGLHILAMVTVLFVFCVVLMILSVAVHP